MGKIIYTVLASADGFFEDVNGNFDWAQPSEAIHKYLNEFEKSTSLFICGRKMYEVMKIWDNFPDIDNMPDYIIEYAKIWKNYRKIVISSTINKVETLNTMIRNRIDKKEIENIKNSEIGNIGIGGANIASQFLLLNLIDEIHIYTFPIIVGSGKKWINSSKNIELDGCACYNFGNGVFLTKYKVKY